MRFLIKTFHATTPFEPVYSDRERKQYVIDKYKRRTVYNVYILLNLCAVKRTLA
jgi:hypothetical protein